MPKNSAIAGQLEGLLAAQQKGDGPPLVKHTTAPPGSDPSEHGSHIKKKNLPMKQGGMNAALAAAAAGKFKERQSDIVKASADADQRLQDTKNQNNQVQTNQHLDESGNLVKASQIKASQGPSPSKLKIAKAPTSTTSTTTTPKSTTTTTSQYAGNYEGYDIEQRLKQKHREVHGTNNQNTAKSPAAKNDFVKEYKFENKKKNSTTTVKAFNGSSWIAGGGGSKSKKEEAKQQQGNKNSDSSWIKK